VYAVGIRGQERTTTCAKPSATAQLYVVSFTFAAARHNSDPRVVTQHNRQRDFFFSPLEQTLGVVLFKKNARAGLGLASLLLIIGLACDVPRSRSERTGTCGSVEGKDDTTCY
jgi:hypothetical protein